MEETIADLATVVPALDGTQVSVMPMVGGVTNRNYRVDVDGRRYVVRIAGEEAELLGIDREVEYTAYRKAAALGIAPEVVAYLPERRVLVTRFTPGRALTEESGGQPHVLRRVVDALRLYHDGHSIPGVFSPFEAIRTSWTLIEDRGIPVPGDTVRAMALLDRLEGAIGKAPSRQPCHNGLTPQDILNDGRAIRIVDWEQAGMGDPFFDLGTLGDVFHLDAEHDRFVLGIYFGHISPEHMRRLQLMRVVAGLFRAMSSFARAGISTLRVDFLAEGRSNLERSLASADALDPDLLKPDVVTRPRSRTTES